MILLDTDHLTVLKYPESPACARLTSRMAASSDPDFATTIVNVEEQMRGWLAAIRRHNDPHRQIISYRRLSHAFIQLREWPIAEWNEPAASHFTRLRAAGNRIGSQDLKIACIALANDALLLSANLRDFEQVPGLHVEDWLQ